MEIRNVKISKYSSGGTASAGAKSYRVSLPSAWIKELGMDINRNAEIRFDGESITIRPAVNNDINSFKSNGIKLGHQLVQYEYFDRDILCSTLLCDFTNKTLMAVNHTDNLLKTAFGTLEKPQWDDFIEFMQERCVPKTRENIDEILQALNLEKYDAIAMVEKTNGKMAEDEQWLKITRL